MYIIITYQIINFNSEPFNLMNNTNKQKIKEKLFDKEKYEIIQNLNELLGLSEHKKSIFYHEFEKNEKAKEYLHNNIENICKYFSNDKLKELDNKIELINYLYAECDYFYDIIKKDLITIDDNSSPLSIISTIVFEQNLKYALSTGTWNIKKKPKSQLYDRLGYLQTLSYFRRINLSKYEDSQSLPPDEDSQSLPPDEDSYLFSTD